MARKQWIRKFAFVFAGLFSLTCSSLFPADDNDPVPSPAVPVTGRGYSSLKIASPPGGGMYIGQYEWNPGDIATFEEAIGRNVALFSVHQPMALDSETEWPVAFDIDEAEKAWQEGKVVLVHAIEAYPHPGAGGFTIDKLLQGEYDDLLHKLADQFRQFGKPMFFTTAREPNGVLEDYFGGFGPDGDKSTEWALENQKGLAEFDPSGFPNASLYADLGDPEASNGVERLIAAQRYYYDFFVRKEGLTFLTFDSMGWAAIRWEDTAEELGLSPGDPNYQLIKTSLGFEYFYPGDEYVDWVSITWYMHDWGEPQPVEEHLERFAAVMEEIRTVAPDKPVFIMELGFPDGANPDSERAAEKVRAGLTELITKHPEINGFAMWSQIHGFDPMDNLVRPGTAQGNAFREIVEANAAYFHSCVYFFDGSQMPACQQCSSGTERPNSVAKTTGAYSCPNCTQEQNWHIDENHIVYWDGEPYIPHAINDFPLMRPLMAEEEVNEILEGIDILMDYGITEIPVELGYLIEESLPYILEDLDKEELTRDDLNALQKEMEDTLAIIVNHITERGGTYILISAIDPVVQQLDGGDIVLHEVGSGLMEGSRALSIEFMLDEKTQQAYREHLRGFRQFAATSGLRGFLFNWETNGQGKIEGAPEELVTELGKILDIYGQMIKEEIGDVPVFYGLADSVTGLNEVLPYLSGVCADNIDGLYIQIHGAMPEEIRFHANQSLVTRQLNSCSRTKLFWGYGQATPLSFVLYRSKQLMHDHFEIMADAGMTGFMYDQVSSWGYIELGMPFDSEELRDQNKRWWGEIRPTLRDKILRYAGANEFSTGRWAIPVEADELKPRAPQMLTPLQAYETALADPEAKRVIDLGAELGEPLFNPDYGIWDVFVFGLEVDIWVEDSEEGRILFTR